MCKNWKEKGTCRYGDKCLFAHGEQELTRKYSLDEAESKATTLPPLIVEVKANLTDKLEAASSSNITESIKILNNESTKVKESV
jgi:hypothetical protein